MVPRTLCSVKWRIAGVVLVGAGLVAGSYLFLKAKSASTHEARDSGIATATEPSAPEAEGGLTGYTAELGSEAVFLQWTEVDGSLTGAAQIDTLVRDKKGQAPFVQSRSVPFTGVLSKSSISLDLGYATWNGTHSDEELVLSYSDSAGSLRTAHFRRSSLTEYRTVVALLEARAADEIAALQEEAAQRSEDERQAELRDNEAERVKAEAVLARFRRTCRGHGGSLTTETPTEFGYDLPPPNGADEYCVIMPAGQGRLQVPIRADGTFFQEAADANREQCVLNKEDARTAAEEGRPWKREPDYHADAGACYRGDPYG
jgi:hypothetical protein